MVGTSSWSQLINELAAFVEATGARADLVRAEALRGDLLQAASYGFDKLTKQQIGEFIRACRYGVAQPHDIHQKIVSLGPRCFVTTNYDNLIEESLRKWQPDRFYRPPITNRQLTETAEIVHARAIDFVFKPHGDAADSESIILTREQYRQLLPQGELQNALESLKILLASRPVVYLGFGLRDPDFIYVRDLLANTYKGGTRDHYAIMSGVSDAERDYWRRNYGIHLINYPTIERPDKSRDHSGLLTLLGTLLEPVPSVIAPASAAESLAVCTPDVVLSLARHAARLARSPKLNPEFQIRVHAEADNSRKAGIYHQPDKFDHSPVESLLDEGPERVLLIGLPGAGKTYALQRAAARLADRLHEACLSEPFDEKTVVVPILVDLKLYRGSLVELVSETMPKSLPFDKMTRTFKLRIFLDSFNEMPRQYWENGSYESDFAKFTANIGDSSLVIGSRTNDGLVKLGMPAYSLDQIDETIVSAEMHRLGIEIGGRFDREVRWLLQKPFYFQLIASGAANLPNEAHPRDLFQSFFGNLRRAFETRFARPFELEKALSLAAYDAINRGEEAYPLSDFLRVLKTSLEEAGLADIDVRDIANWLVSASVLIPHTGERVAFVHQSVTEYLAADELARRYRTNAHILKEKLSLTRWDQALFLALGLLSPPQAEAFLQDVVKADFGLALNAAKYIEVGRDEVVSRLLTELHARAAPLEPFESSIAWALESSLPVSEVHEPQLRRLMELGNTLGAAAVKRLAKLKGAAAKEELLQLLFDARDDFNYCWSGIGPALKPFATNDDARKVAAMADSIQDMLLPDSDADDAGGFRSGAAEFLAGLDLAIVWQALFQEPDAGRASDVRIEILCSILEKHHSTAALNLAGELLLRGVNKAAVAIYFISRFSKPDCDLSWVTFTSDHIDRLESIIDDSDEDWGLDALQCVCAARQDLAELVTARASKKSGIVKAALLYCASHNEITPVFEALRELTRMSEEQRCEQPTHLLKSIELNWAGKEDLFVALLRLRDPALVIALLGDAFPANPSLGQLDIGQIEWWLEWMLETKDDHWFRLQLGGLLAGYVANETRDAFVTEFNKSDSKFRRLLQHFVLLHRSDLTPEMFSEDALSFLLADLNREGSSSGAYGHLLGSIATENFVTERLLPLLPDARSPLSENLQKVLRQAGSRHGRRYVVG